MLTLDEAIRPWPWHPRLWRLALWKTLKFKQVPANSELPHHWHRYDFLLLFGFCLAALPFWYQGQMKMYRFKELNQSKEKHELRFHRKRKKNVKKEIKYMCPSTNWGKHIFCISGIWSELVLLHNKEGILQLKRTLDSHTFYLERPQINKSAQK